MAPRSEKSQLKRQRGNEESDLDFKKPRRSERLSNLGAPTAPVTPVASPAQARPAPAGRHAKSHHTSKQQQKQHLPSPQTHSRATDDDDDDEEEEEEEEDDEHHSLREATATPPDGRVPGQAPPKVGSDDVSSPAYNTFSSPPQDTQPFSQFVDPDAILSDEVEDEVKEGVWGYLFPLNTRYGGRCQVLKKRTACPKPDNSCNQANSSKKAGKSTHGKDGDDAKSGANSATSGGYLIGRHPECDIVVDDISVSNRHCLIFTEHKGNDTVAILEDLSSNGTFINDALIGRNQRRELQEQDEIAVLDKARFIFKYPKTRQTSAFLQQYTLLEKLGKGHFAEVFLCVEKATGQRYAVKIFTKHPSIEERSKTEGLQQEIAVLMGVSHPNVLCLKDTFNERNAVYLVLELAAEGELFNYIVMKQKLTEDESRKLFLQLFHGVKYLHDRNIVHRDIKPENILMVDKDLHVKLADFGLAKIIGEESFTTTLCGTPSYVAPEILADSRNRKYTKAVDIWSLGVVLYICLCGFPPFSDELFSQDFPFTLSQQIRSGRFDYPSPYWDSVGDPALDLIDSMLVVDPEKRFTIDQCLSHPWMTHAAPGVNDSTGGLVGGIQGLDVNRRGVARERTMLSSLNYVEVTTAKVGAGDKPAVKIFSKNKNKNKGKVVNAARKEAGPSHQRDAGEFMEMGGKGDVELFSHDGNSVYSKADLAAEKKKKAKGGR